MFLLACFKTFRIFQCPVRLYIYQEYLLKYLSLVGMCTIYQTSSLHVYLDIAHIVFFLSDNVIKQLLMNMIKVHVCEIILRILC